MKIERSDEIEGKMELRHDAVPPFKGVLFVATGIGAIYLGLIFLFSL
jgi:hypothetical protein